MKKSVVMKFAASAVVLASTAIGCKPATESRPMALSATTPKAADGAEKAASRATDALAKKKTTVAIAAAEQAVALQPLDARYRLLLGRTYLAGGRFASAEASFGEAVTLDPQAGRARVNLALTQIAAGDSSAARATLVAAQGKVAESDRGLALALAGDPTGAVRVLEAVARGHGADAKTRQNLALAYALSGDWAKAQATASQDLSPAEVATRMTEWAKFAHATDATKQVASLLDITPAFDPGRPAQLALTPIMDEPVAVAAAEIAPVEIAAAVPVPAPAVEAVPPPTFYAPPARRVALPPLIRAPRAAAKVAYGGARVPALLAAPKRVSTGLVRQGRGEWVVQLGAFSQKTTIEAAWTKVSRAYRPINAYAPSQAVFTRQSATLTRLSLAGFASRDAAIQVCTRIRAAGGDCFVRAAAGEAPVQMAAWKSRVQLASR